MPFPPEPVRTAVLHGAGYVGGELVGLLLGHPAADLAAVTSRTFQHRPLGDVHARLAGTTGLAFSAPDGLDVSALDAAFVCAEHGQGGAAVGALRDAGFGGLIVDLSADHRLAGDVYRATYEREPPATLPGAVYGLADAFPERVAAAGPSGLVANPGCFATGLALAAWPLALAWAGQAEPFEAHATALTGASGSGARPSATTHFPARDGNVRAYKVLGHRHLPEVERAIGAAREAVGGPGGRVRFVPASGPWTRGIWGTLSAALPAGLGERDVAEAFVGAYAERPLVRLRPALPELLPTVGTPFCDVGWEVAGGTVVVGFALDNLLKGAASQAVQNLNLALGLPEALGLLPGVAAEPRPA